MKLGFLTATFDPYDFSAVNSTVSEGINQTALGIQSTVVDNLPAIVGVIALFVIVGVGIGFLTKLKKAK